MNRHKRRHAAARVRQNLARLQRVQTQRLQADAHLKCAIAHKLELQPRDAPPRRRDRVRVDRQALLDQQLPRREAQLIFRVEVRTGGEQRVHKRHLGAERVLARGREREMARRSAVPAARVHARARCKQQEAARDAAGRAGEMQRRETEVVGALEIGASVDEPAHLRLVAVDASNVTARTARGVTRLEIARVRVDEQVHERAIVVTRRRVVQRRRTAVVAQLAIHDDAAINKRGDNVRAHGGRFADSVPVVQRRASTDQQQHNGVVRCSNGRIQRRASRQVKSGQIGGVTERQQLDDLHATELRGNVTRCLAAFVGVVDARTCAQQQTDNVAMTAFGSANKRRRSCVD